MDGLKISVSNYCSLVGVILACFILSFGFFKTLFVLICGALGAFAGYYVKEKYLNK